MKTIGFIGVGDLALYTINGLRRGGYNGTILLSPRNAEKAAWLAQQQRCEVGQDNQAVVDNSELVIISTRPADCLDTLSRLEFRSGQVLLSVVAGMPIEALRSALPDGLEIVRAMPVSSAEVGSSPTLVFPQHDFICALFDHCGRAIPLEREQAFDQGSILACVYSWFFALYDELIEATQGPGLPPQVARQLVMGMARGAADLALADSERTPGEIASAIATAGTFSRQGLDLLSKQDAFGPWRDACVMLEKQLAGS